MPLTHVCMWSEHGWKRITAPTAARLHPGGTVSAKSGLFMCELCGQYVTLTDGLIRDPYFKHSAEELSKDCPERTFATYVPTTFQAGTHDLPLRLRLLGLGGFELQLGLLPVPKSLLEKHSKDKISISFPDGNKLSYSFERVLEGTTTYLSVGRKPYEKYSISLETADDRLTSFWPKSIEGISRSGALFDSVTGKKLPYDADTVVNHKYYLLTTKKQCKKYNGISTSQIFESSSTSYPRWYIHEVYATSFEESTARFFLDYHCRLTENAVDIIPLWPVYIETPYRLCHCSDQIEVFLRGDATPKVFPFTTLDSFDCGNGDGKVFSVKCKERQQILSVGRAKVLKYTYLWKDTLDYQGPVPQITVTDLDGNVLQQGCQTGLPRNKTIVIKASFDGCVLRKKNDSIIERYPLYAEEALEIDHIQRGYSIEILQGLDKVWEADYALSLNNDVAIDDDLLHRLMGYRDHYIDIPHSTGALAMKMNDYPKTKSWLYSCIKDGRMPQQAYKLLTHHFAGR